MQTRSHIGGVGRTVAGILIAPIIVLSLVWVGLWMAIGIAWILEAVGLT